MRNVRGFISLTACFFAIGPLVPACSGGDASPGPRVSGDTADGGGTYADGAAADFEGGSGSGGSVEAGDAVGSGNNGGGGPDAGSRVDVDAELGVPESGGGEVAMPIEGGGGSDSGAVADTSNMHDAISGEGSAPEAGAYEPCPASGTPCAIMPLGDSITNGATATNKAGYRAPLFHLAHAASKSITFVGSQSSGPATIDNVAFPPNHEGHSGYNIEPTQGRHGLTEVIPQSITTYKPRIVLLMIGTNDVNTGETMAPVRLGNLMDSILNADPTLLLVVAQIVPQQMATPDTLNMQVQAYNAAIPGLVSARAAAGKHVTMVDMHTAFVSTANYSTALMYNTLHPNDAGYSVMADTWYAAIGTLLR